MSGQTVQMNPYTAKIQRCVVHRSRFDSWCNQEGVGSTLAAAKIVNNFNPQNWDFGKNKRYQDEISLIPFYYEIKGNFYSSSSSLADSCMENIHFYAQTFSQLAYLSCKSNFVPFLIISTFLRSLQLNLASPYLRFLNC